ncbi:MAG: NAD(P)/FAD-dependent oxidoreductase [Bacteroidota bacterium]|nr:NAD(P)/FAD-dependent oxidoreductase [Bacteroidota bacterium]
MKANIPEVENKRIVIIGGGFAGLTLARKLVKSNYQIVLLDKHNYHMFQPLFYQVATAGIEPSAISFPYRKVFQSKNNIHIRKTEVLKVEPENNRVLTKIGEVNYDYLVVAVGATTNYFGNEDIQLRSYPMKSVAEALTLRNSILQNFENILISDNAAEQEAMMNFVVVGGGPTGVETAGALAEMKRFVLPKDYPEIDFNRMNIYLVEAAPRLLGGMSEASSKRSYQYLMKLGVKVWLNAAVKAYDNDVVELSNGASIPAKTMVWAAGVRGNTLEGLNPEIIGRGNRIVVDSFNAVKGYSNIFAIGDVALMQNEKFPNGYPQVAQVAIQQAANLVTNFKNMEQDKTLNPFHYRDLGSMATVGRNLAVVDLPFVKFYGWFAWLVWMFIHLKSILGVRNKMVTFVNWFWNYITYDQSLRLIIKAKARPVKG